MKVTADNAVSMSTHAARKGRFQLEAAFSFTTQSIELRNDEMTFGIAQQAFDVGDLTVMVNQFDNRQTGGEAFGQVANGS